MAADIEAELATPPFPTEVTHIWNAWARIRRRLSSGLNGPAPVTWTELDAFLRRSGQLLFPHEIDLLEIIDDAYMASLSAGPSDAEQSQSLVDSLDRLSKPQES